MLWILSQSFQRSAVPKAIFQPLLEELLKLAYILTISRDPFWTFCHEVFTSFKQNRKARCSKHGDVLGARALREKRNPRELMEVNQSSIDFPRGVGVRSALTEAAVIVTDLKKDTLSLATDGSLPTPWATDNCWQTHMWPMWHPLQPLESASIFMTKTVFILYSSAGARIEIHFFGLF